MPEQDDIDDLPITDQITLLMEDLPLPVQRFLTSQERNKVSLGLSQKYRLHTDAAGAFERAYVYMLLGVFTPDEFAKELRDAGLDEETIRGIATDVNERVFKRLREEERVETPAPAVQPRPQVPVMEVGKRDSEVPPNLPGQSIPQTQFPQSLPTPTASIPIPQQEPVIPAPIPAQAVRPVQYVPPQTAYQPAPSAPIYSNPESTTPQPESYHPAARTMAQDMEFAAHGYSGQASQPLQNVPAHAQHIPPAPTQTAPAPQSYAPAKTPIATAVPETHSMNYPPPAMARVHLTPVDRTHTDAPITKEYGSDPYRESIE